MQLYINADPPTDWTASPLYLLAVLFAARRTKDRPLERVTRRKLEALGIRIAFGDELPALARKKRAGHE